MKTVKLTAKNTADDDHSNHAISKIRTIAGKMSHTKNFIKIILLSCICILISVACLTENKKFYDRIVSIAMRLQNL